MSEASMRRTILGDRTADPARFTMAAEPNGGLRLGDRAAAYAFLAHWRARHPQRRLTILDDPFQSNCAVARQLTPHLLFGAVADEIIEAEFLGESLPRLPGEELLVRTLWEEWEEVKASDFPVPLLPMPEVSTAWDKLQKIYGGAVPKSYLTIQPLLDAVYDVERNFSAAWWQDLITALAVHVPVLILGLPTLEDLLEARFHHATFQGDMQLGWFPLFQCGLTVPETLTLIGGAVAHVGGETGTTLWAPIQQIPTVAFYQISLRNIRGWWARPIAFRQPVQIHYPPPLTGAEAADLVLAFLTDLPRLKAVAVATKRGS